jgi:hypothetical protein
MPGNRTERFPLAALTPEDVESLAAAMQILEDSLYTRGEPFVPTPCTDPLPVNDLVLGFVSEIVALSRLVPEGELDAIDLEYFHTTLAAANRCWHLRKAYSHTARGRDQESIELDLASPAKAPEIFGERTSTRRRDRRVWKGKRRGLM